MGPPGLAPRAMPSREVSQVGFRGALLGVQTAPGPMVVVSATAAIALLVSGMYYFRRMERTFADVV